MKSWLTNRRLIDITQQYSLTVEAYSVSIELELDKRSTVDRDNSKLKPFSEIITQSFLHIDIMTEFEPFRLSIPQDSLDRLKQKLSLTFLPDELEDSEWEYGTPLADVRRLLHYWQEKYDWRHHEAQINKLPQYTTRISVKDFDDLDLHFLHQPSSVKNAIPLLFVHGCMFFTTQSVLVLQR